MVIFFTGTGNSRYCARVLAQLLGDGLTDAFRFIRSGTAITSHSEKPWVFVSPTYGWRLPRVFTQFLRSAQLQGSRDAYFVMTCGSETGAPEPYLRTLCEQMGLTYRGMLEVVMPENYIVMFDAPEEEDARKIVAAARPVLERAAGEIRAGADLSPRRTGVLDALRSGPINALFYRFCVKAKHFRATETCIGCGKCADSCVLGNIRLQDGRPVWSDRCTHCMACICSCPVQAIEYGKASLGKPRYQCPDMP